MCYFSKQEHIAHCKAKNNTQSQQISGRMHTHVHTHTHTRIHTHTLLLLSLSSLSLPSPLQTLSRLHLFQKPTLYRTLFCRFCTRLRATFETQAELKKDNNDKMISQCLEDQKQTNQDQHFIMRMRQSVSKVQTYVCQLRTVLCGKWNIMKK